MLRKIIPFLATVFFSVTISIVITVLLLQPSEKKDTEGSEFGSVMLMTDEQAAEQQLSDRQVFENLSDEQIAFRALSAICDQLKGSLRCGRLQNYVYLAGKEASSLGATATFWYRPQSGFPDYRRIETRHIHCRFRNETWVFCHLLGKNPPEARTFYARVPAEFETEQLETKVRLRLKGQSSADRP